MTPRLMTAMFLLTIPAVPAGAQPVPQELHNQSIGGGAQWALPHSGRGEAPGVQLSWRRWFTPYLGVGTEVRWFQRNTTTEIDFPTQTAPGGIVVQAQHGLEQQQISSYGFAGGLVARASMGRLTFIGGAGPGFFVDRTSHDTRINDGRNTGTITVSSLGGQMLLELEVRATSRVSAFAGLRMEIRDVRSMESSSGYPTAGVRFAF